MRKIVHIDMDAFYAAVEQRDDPALRGRPVAVGGRSERGVVMAASYEARRFGVRSALPTSRARRLCPDLVVLPPRFEAYREASRQIRAIFARYTALVAPLALDEAALDVTAPLTGPPSATLIARAIKAEIRAATGLTASAGVSYNRFLAKLASDMDKPDGLVVILPEDAPGILAALPIERFYGIGPVTARRLRAEGIATGADLQALSLDELLRRFGRAGRHFHDIARGIDERPVDPVHLRKSVGVERTFERDLVGLDALAAGLAEIAPKLALRLAAADGQGRTLTLKIKYRDFSLHTRSRTSLCLPEHTAGLLSLGRELLTTPSPPARPVRLLGLSVHNFTRAPAVEQLELDFEPPASSL